jgi:hypothetical protein
MRGETARSIAIATDDTPAPIVSPSAVPPAPPPAPAVPYLLSMKVLAAVVGRT